MLSAWSLCRKEKSRCTGDRAGPASIPDEGLPKLRRWLLSRHLTIWSMVICCLDDFHQKGIVTARPYTSRISILDTSMLIVDDPPRQMTLKHHMPRFCRRGSLYKRYSSTLVMVNSLVLQAECKMWCQEMVATWWKHMGISTNGKSPNGWFLMDNAIKMDDLGVALLQEASI